MNRLALLAVVLVLGFCGTARATTVTTVDPWTTEPYAGWLASTTHVPLPTLVGVRNSATFCGGAPEVFSCTDLEGAIYMRHRLTLRSRRVRFMHEVGHNVDWQLLNDEDRRVFASLSGYGTLFQPEVFAELYARCATGGHPPAGWRTTPAELASVCAWLASA